MKHQLANVCSTKISALLTLVLASATPFAGAAAQDAATTNPASGASVAPSAAPATNPAPAATPMAGMSGSSMAGMAGNSMSGMAGNSMSGMGGNPMAGMAGNEPAGAKVVATVNGINITEADLKLAEDEIGRDLGNLGDATKRRVLVEFLIENNLFAKAAEESNLAQGNDFDDRMRYWRNRALRDAYFEKQINAAVGEAAARAYYDDQIKTVQPKEEVQARHILVETEDQAKDLKGKIDGGADFATLAKENSKDPGTKEDGGMLGYFAAGQMVPDFETAAFALQKGQVSAPVKSQFGWHIIKLEDRRQKPLPTFDEVKDRILANMMHQRAQAIAAKLRNDAKIEYVDPEIKKEVEEQASQQDSQRKQLEEMIKKQIEAQEKGTADAPAGEAKPADGAAKPADAGSKPEEKK